MTYSNEEKLYDLSVPMKHIHSAEEMAEVAAFLALVRNYLTGQTIAIIDGVYDYAILIFQYRKSLLEYPSDKGERLNVSTKSCYLLQVYWREPGLSPIDQPPEEFWNSLL